MADTTRAKFRIVSVTDIYTGNGDQRESSVDLVPVYDPDPESENGKFYKYTPGGKISLSTVNPFVRDFFKRGGEFYVDFTPAGKEEDA